MTNEATAAVRNELAPTGTLRAAINFGNPVLAQKDPATGEARGMTVDIARELGRRLGVAVEPHHRAFAELFFDLLHGAGERRITRGIARRLRSGDRLHHRCSGFR